MIPSIVLVNCDQTSIFDRVGWNVPLTTGCLKKLHQILKINFGAVRFSMTKMSVLPDSRGIYNHLIPKVLDFMRQQIYDNTIFGKSIFQETCMVRLMMMETR